MIVGIDASNLRLGGGVTHLRELLNSSSPEGQGFAKVVIWAGRSTLDQLPERPWLVKQHLPTLDGGLLRRTAWQAFTLADLARREKCDVLFVPGGSFSQGFRPTITMSRNMLPFEWRELRRYGWSWMALKMLLLRLVQTRSFRKADGVIFLTAYARRVVMDAIGHSGAAVTTIPHGIDERFFRAPREQASIDQYSDERPFRVLYVSTIEVYKHQWRVVEAIAELRRAGVPVSLELIGPAYPPALRRLKRTLAAVGDVAKFVRYEGTVPFEELHTKYAEADVCVFASSCENLPIILLEGMASGLPIASSSKEPMPEVLGDAGVYFDPEDARDIARALRELIESPELRRAKAAASFARSRNFSWTECSTGTFSFLATCTQISSTEPALVAAAQR